MLHRSVTHFRENQCKHGKYIQITQKIGPLWLLGAKQCAILNIVRDRSNKANVNDDKNTKKEHYLLNNEEPVFILNILICNIHCGNNKDTVHAYKCL